MRIVWHILKIFYYIYFENLFQVSVIWLTLTFFQVPVVLLKMKMHILNVFFFLTRYANHL